MTQTTPTLARRLLIAIFTTITFLNSATKAQVATDTPDLLEQGLALLTNAAEIEQTQPARARSLAADSAALLNAHRVEHPDLERNAAFQRALGNAYLLADDLGRAVLAYNRALAADPSDYAAAQSLAFARAQIGTTTSDTDTAPWRQTLTLALAKAPREPMLWTSATLLTLSFVVFSLRVIRPSATRTWSTPTALTLIFLSATLGVLLLVDPARPNPDHAVVIASAPAHTGPDASIYPAVFEEPIPAGTEVTRIEHRAGWTRVALGRTPAAPPAWLPNHAIEPVLVIEKSTPPSPNAP